MRSRRVFLVALTACVTSACGGTSTASETAGAPALTRYVAVAKARVIQANKDMDNATHAGASAFVTPLPGPSERQAVADRVRAVTAALRALTRHVSEIRQPTGLRGAHSFSLRASRPKPTGQPGSRQDSKNGRTRATYRSERWSWPRGSRFQTLCKGAAGLENRNDHRASAGGSCGAPVAQELRLRGVRALAVGTPLRSPPNEPQGREVGSVPSSDAYTGSVSDSRSRG